MGQIREWSGSHAPLGSFCCALQLQGVRLASRTVAEKIESNIR